MFQADEVVESILAHRTDEPYNPEKRREYYLRTRELKGRTTTGDDTAKKPTSSVTRAPSKPLPKKTSTPKKPTTAEVEQTVEALKAKLAALRKVLAELVAQAKARSGVEDPASSTEPSKSGGTKPTSPEKTEQEKAEAAKKAKEYYEKNKDKILSDQVKELGEKLEAVAKKIRELRAKLASPVSNTPKPSNRPVGVGQPTQRKENGQNGG